MLALGDLEGRRRRARATGAVGRVAGPQRAASTSTPEVGVEHARVGLDLGRRAGRRCSGRSRARRRGRRRPSRGPCGARPAGRPSRRRAARISSPSSAMSSSPRPPAGSSSSSSCGRGDERAGERDPLLDAVGEAARVAGRPRSATPSSSSAASAASRSRALVAVRAREPEQRAPAPARARAASAPTITFSSAVSPANSPRPCSVRAMPSRASCVRAEPASAAPPPARPSPASARTKPQMTLNSVVLPAPLGPITPTTSPGATVSDTSSSAVSPPKRTVSRLDLQHLRRFVARGGALIVAVRQSSVCPSV